jgi:hypothetical protein
MSSSRYADLEGELRRTYGLTYGGLIDLNQYVASLRGEFPNLNDEEKNKLIASLLAVRFTPLGDDLSPSAEAVAKEQALALPKTPYYRIYTRPMTFGGAAHEVARMAGIELMGTTQERLRDILMSRFKGIRIDAQVEEQLKRSAEFGGIGLDPERARTAAAAIRDIIARTTLLSEQEYSEWLAEETRRRHAPAPEEGRASKPPEPEEDRLEAKEVAHAASKMPAKILEQTKVLNDAVHAIVERIPSRPTDDYLVRRLESIISTRLRDVRSRNEVLLKLMREVKVGGMDMDRATAERVAEEIEKGYKEFRSAIHEEEKSRLFKQLADQEKKIEERKRREAEAHARWYEEKIKSRQLADEEKKKVLERMKVIAQGYTTPIPSPVEAKEKVKEKAAFGELVPAAPAPPPAALIGPKESPVPEAPRAPMAPAAPAKPVVKVSRETAEAVKQVPGARPRVEDVKVVRQRLTGPLQEIGGMTLESLRRLGTPEDAVRKVTASIDLLGQESFERRVQGIQAWQGSPLQQLYLSLLAEAFKGKKSVNALAEEKRKAGSDVPTPDELQAIITLNTKLRL